ncbi:hypothetical protein DS745_03650 [Anaerobacillus alkaliphilus]|uniref:Uncharacterized protein n=1 Tax=Anaerobacillus alkaliphilus TaxID=1548597 RepID=A0A4Q0VZR2_9BACI|nr:hypothetical protein [Anaerobacillus alkaliphilus]RXJ04488.1 hypothetical protein DS745_03650 [Anaerobacillus alkaliphilus]
MESFIYIPILLAGIGLVIAIVQSLIDRSINQFKSNEYEEKIKDLEARMEKLEDENRELYFHIHSRGKL